MKSPGTSTSLDISDGTENSNQRILPSNEPIMDAVACWNGFTMRFIIRKKNAVSHLYFFDHFI